MGEVVYIVQRPGEGPVILNACRELASGIDCSRFTGLYAFASYKGARLLVDALKESSPNWSRSEKRWVVSIDGGVTEPEALSFLLSQTKSLVHVPDAEGLLRRKLRPVHRFHPKTLLLETGRDLRRAAGLLVGSANLTCNGLCHGYEQILLTKFRGQRPVPARISKGLDELEVTIDAATQIDEAFVARYEAIRPRTPRISEVLDGDRFDRILLDEPIVPAFEAASFASSDNLWVEIDYVVQNRGPNVEGNQIDLKRGSRVFFGFNDQALPRNTAIGTVTIRFDTHSALRNLRFGNNQMDKLDLPIPGHEGPASYSNKTLLFTREDDGTYRLAVGTPGQVQVWKRRSRRLGTLFRMRSGREYGVF